MSAPIKTAEGPEGGDSVADVLRLLGEPANARSLGTAFDVHDMVRNGLPAAALYRFLDDLTVISAAAFASALGVSERTVQRIKKKDAGERLTADQSDRVWQFAEVLAKAIGVFGTRDAAERWLNEPAIGLNRRRPIDLLGTTIGTEAVKTYLDRIDYGVYA